MFGQYKILKCYPRPVGPPVIILGVEGYVKSFVYDDIWLEISLYVGWGVAHFIMGTLEFK
jgi:hypothetical protein